MLIQQSCTKKYVQYVQYNMYNMYGYNKSKWSIMQWGNPLRPYVIEDFCEVGCCRQSSTEFVENRACHCLNQLSLFRYNRITKKNINVNVKQHNHVMSWSIVQLMPGWRILLRTLGTSYTPELWSGCVGTAPTIQYVWVLNNITHSMQWQEQDQCEYQKANQEFI